MCGIAGSINARLSDQDLNLIRHRGPDHQALAQISLGEDNIFLGYTRLAIQDLSYAGLQPMWSSCGNYCIVFNGEIYNHLELRGKLGDVNFKGHSDTETILYYLRAKGIEAVREFKGIFAFAFLDKVQRKLYMVRDQLGVKPLYYFFNGQALVFASELKILAVNPSYKKAINLSALNTLLTFRYNPAPETMFKDIFKLKAAHYLVFDFTQRSMREVHYWDRAQKINHHISEQEATEEYQNLLRQAVKRQLLSDVPLGLLLSGGLDSAMLGLLMTEFSSRPIKSFTVGFEEKGEHNELEDAQKTAQLIHSEHFEVTMSKKDYFEDFYRSFYHVEEPIAEPTIPALMRVSKLASRHVKVVLSGQGIDELMAGYKRYRGEQLLSRYQFLLPCLPLDLVRKLYPRNEALARAFTASKYKNDLDRFIGIYTLFTGDIKNQLYQERLKPFKNEDLKRYFKCAMNSADKTGGSLSQLLYVDARTMLPDNLLLFNDKITMANSIENRVPYLDIDLVNFIESLPVNYKLKGSTGKYLHRRAARGWVPDEIINRKKKTFQTPVDEWFQGELAMALSNLVTDVNSFSRNYFDIGMIQKMIDLHSHRKQNYKRELFILFTLELWYRCFYLSVSGPDGQSANNVKRGVVQPDKIDDLN